MAIVYVPRQAGHYTYRFACDRCGLEETNLDLLHVVLSGLRSEERAAPTLLLCRACHNAVERDLASKGVTGWDHLSEALIFALGQSGFDDDEMKTLRGLLVR